MRSPLVWFEYGGKQRLLRLSFLFIFIRKRPLWQSTEFHTFVISAQCIFMAFLAHTHNHSFVENCRFCSIIMALNQTHCKQLCVPQTRKRKWTSSLQRCLFCAFLFSNFNFNCLVYWTHSKSLKIIVNHQKIRCTVWNKSWVFVKKHLLKNE